MGTTRKVTITQEVEITVDDDLNIYINDFGSFDLQELKRAANRTDLKPIYIAMYEAGLEVYQQVVSARALFQARTGDMFWVELDGDQGGIVAIVVEGGTCRLLRSIHGCDVVAITPEEVWRVKSVGKIRQRDLAEYIETHRPTANDEARQ